MADVITRDKNAQPDPNEKFVLSYYLHHEMWWANSLHQAGMSEPKERRQIVVGLDHMEGGCAWEFTIIEVQGIGIKLHMFDDSWRAFTQIPELFSAIAELDRHSGRCVSLDEIQGVLDAIGFRDRTERKSPHAREDLSRATQLRLQAKELLKEAESVDGIGVTALSERKV